MKRSRWFALVAASSAIAATTAHAVAEQRAELRTRTEIGRLLQNLESLPTPARHGKLDVSINGSSSTIAMTTEPVPLDQATSAVVASCGEDEETGGGNHVGGDTRPLWRKKSVHRDDAADGSASVVLCVFESAVTKERRERLTVVKRSDPNVSSITTLIASNADPAAMFPLEGDAPGGDLAGVPRPRASRRTLAASIRQTGYAVRIYELETFSPAAEDAVATFDRQMTEQGFTSSNAVAASVADARLYTRGSERIVVSFAHARRGGETGGVARIVLARPEQGI